MIVTIKKVDFEPKYVDIWFEEDILPDVEFHMDKPFKLWEAADRAKMLKAIYNTGFKGKKLQVEMKDGDLQIIAMVPELTDDIAVVDAIRKYVQTPGTTGTLF